MPGKTVNSAIFLLVIGNALALVSDVIIKLLEEDAPVFQFVFLRSLITLALLLPFWQQVDRARLFAGARVHFTRAHLHLIGMVTMVYALLNLPLATANAVFYAAPILVMLLSVVFFGERLSRFSLLAVFSGFAGILVILRPVDFSWSALAALATALTLAINAVLVRRLPAQQSTVHKLLLNYIMILPLCAALMLWEGAQWSWNVLLSALGSAVFILGYNISVLLAYRQVDANQITSAEYTGLLWAVAIGWIWFAEVPDLWFFIGSLMIILPLVMLGLQHRKRVRSHNHHLPDTRYHPAQSYPETDRD